MITVIGYDGRALPDVARAAVDAAELVVGGKRHLDAVGVSPSARRIELGDVGSAVEQVRGRDAVVVASGDPGFFGIVRALRAAALPVTVLPAVSSVAQAFARAGVEWDDALVVSAHGRDVRRAVNCCLRFPKVAVLTDVSTGPAVLGVALRGVERVLVVAERLGEPDERVVRTTPAAAAVRDDWRDPNVVVVLDPAAPVAPPRALAGPRRAGVWALPDIAFEHRDGMVTKAELRAFVLARLAPGTGDLVWDVGAGSGSVAVECARLGAAAVAVEHDEESCRRIEANASAHGVPVDVVHGKAPDVLSDLREPDAVFVGGGGIGVLRACADRRPPRLVTALAALERVGPALDVLWAHGYEPEAVQLQANRLVPLPGGSHRLAATNPTVVVAGDLP